MAQRCRRRGWLMSAPFTRHGQLRRHRGERRQAAADSHSAARRRDQAGSGSRPRRHCRHPGLAGRFELPPNHTEGERRAALAGWLTDPNNPLAWRSIVNRVWQYHFGRGHRRDAERLRPDGPARRRIRNCSIGSPPSSATAAVRSRQLHQLIVTSATYRQAFGR